MGGLKSLSIGPSSNPSVQKFSLDSFRLNIVLIKYLPSWSELVTSQTIYKIQGSRKNTVKRHCKYLIEKMGLFLMKKERVKLKE